MKKITLSLIILLIAISTFAARPTGLRLGGGYSMNFYNSDLQDIKLIKETLDYGQFYGGFVDVGYDWNLSNHSTISFGGKLNMLFNGEVSKVKDIYSGQLTNRLYLDIPLLYQFAFNVSTKVQIFIAAGPTANFWLTNGTTYLISNTGTKKTDGKYVNWFKDNDDLFNRINVSLGGQLGVYFSHVKIYAGYDHSLMGYFKDISSSYGQARIGAAYVF